LQRIDDVRWVTIAALNEGADVPDLAVILGADPAVIARRLEQRGGHSRFEAMPGAARIETDLYDDTPRRLAGSGWPVWCIDGSTGTPAELAEAVAGRILATIRFLPETHDAW
jgi:dTMP kinase